MSGLPSLQNWLLNRCSSKIEPEALLPESHPALERSDMGRGIWKSTRGHISARGGKFAPPHSSVSVRLAAKLIERLEQLVFRVLHPYLCCGRLIGKAGGKTSKTPRPRCGPEGSERAENALPSKENIRVCGRLSLDDSRRLGFSFWSFVAPELGIRKFAPQFCCTSYGQAPRSFLSVLAGWVVKRSVSPFFKVQSSFKLLLSPSLASLYVEET